MNRILMIAYGVSVALSWLSLGYMVMIHASRIMEGKSLGVFGVVFSMFGFCLSLPFYAIGIRSRLRFYHHVIYWMPFLIAIAMGEILGVTFAP
jgi:hypothetical protein